MAHSVLDIPMEPRQQRTERRSPRRTTHRKRLPEAYRYRLDRNGRQHFSFPQRLWLAPGVVMACTPGHSTALTTLALNLLADASAERSTGAQLGMSDRRALDLARAFAEDCLLSAPTRGWVIPRAAIEAWLRSRSGHGASVPAATAASSDSERRHRRCVRRRR